MLLPCLDFKYLACPLVAYPFSVTPAANLSRTDQRGVIVGVHMLRHEHIGVGDPRGFEKEPRRLYQMLHRLLARRKWAHQRKIRQRIAHTGAPAASTHVETVLAQMGLPSVVSNIWNPT